MDYRIAISENTGLTMIYSRLKYQCQWCVSVKTFISAMPSCRLFRTSREEILAERILAVSSRECTISRRLRVWHAYKYIYTPKVRLSQSICAYNGTLHAASRTQCALHVHSAATRIYTALPLSLSLQIILQFVKLRAKNILALTRTPRLSR